MCRWKIFKQVWAGWRRGGPIFLSFQRLLRRAPRGPWLITPFFKCKAVAESEMISRRPLWKEGGAEKEVTFFPTFEVGHDGEGRGETEVSKKKAREDRVNEMPSKDKLNRGRKETGPGPALLIDSSQTHSFQVFQSLNS